MGKSRAMMSLLIVPVMRLCSLNSGFHCFLERAIRYWKGANDFEMTYQSVMMVALSFHEFRFIQIEKGL